MFELLNGSFGVPSRRQTVCTVYCAHSGPVDLMNRGFRIKFVVSSNCTLNLHSAGSLEYEDTSDHDLEHNHDN